jgi:hypothetical protein
MGACQKDFDMGRKLILTTVCAITLAFCGSGHAQDSPSLGDLARQAQKNKSNAPAKKVFTNDDFAPAPAAAPSIDSGLAASDTATPSPAAPGAPAAAGKSNEPPTALQAIDRMEGVINQMDTLDRAALAKFVLQGVDKNFPGRPAWEEKLFSAKQVFVTQGRDFIRKARSMVANAEPAKDAQGTNGSGASAAPAATDDRLQGMIQYGARIESAFQEVISEGRDLATKVPAQ